MECSIESGTEKVKDNGPFQLHKCSPQISQNVPENENSNNIVDNHYNNSNHSDSPDSVKCAPDKPESTEKQDVQHNIESKDKDEDIVKPLITQKNEASLDEIVSEDVTEEISKESDVPTTEDDASANLNIKDEISQESETKNENSVMTILENDNKTMTSKQNGEAPIITSREVHEIALSDNDDNDCVVTNEKKSESETKVQLRRSSRAIKRKIYNNEDIDEESEVVEVMAGDPLNRKNKAVVINDNTSMLVDMAVKQMKSNQGKKRRTETTVVIIDTESVPSNKGFVQNQTKNSMSSTNSSMYTQSTYQNMVARSTTVTAINSKTTTATQAQQSILPSLTDDMFVVEAPSFIVPYVYEKPSLKPFREFVDILGKELEEQEAAEEKERLAKEMEEKERKEKEKEEKERKEKENEESKARGEEVSEPEVKTEKILIEDALLEERKKKKAEKKERQKHRNEDDDVSWDGDSSTDSSDEVTDDEDKIQLNKDKLDPVDALKGIIISDVISEKVVSGKSDNYFDCSLGKFFINIGLNLVQEYVQNDLLKQQNRKLQREKKSGHNTKATQTCIASLMNNLHISKKNNLPYSHPQKKCEFCSFKTESMLVMSNHLETPHMKNNVYKCNYCTFEIRSPHDILYHMELKHNIKGKLERAPAYHQCANCPFEDNGKGKLARHLIPCAKKFKPEFNLAPPIEWEPPAKIPKISKSRNTVMSTFQSAFNRQMGNNLGRPHMNMSNLMPNISNAYRPRGRNPLVAPPRATPVQGTPIVRGVTIRHNNPSSGINFPAANNGKNISVPKSLHQPSISITPLPRQPQPAQSQLSQQSKGTFVICEICDGYIKDLEQLRNHMQWIHKVKIHPKMIYNRPPLNCQKCQFRFFTDQGLERHLLGSHGLVTSSMQEAANKGKDSGRCPVCGRVYQWKLLNHVARDHNLTLKPAHLSYKCTVCTATFGMYKQFENHVYSAHSVVAKRVMDKSKTSTSPAKPNSDTHLKSLKINDEITIIPQPIKQSTPTPSKEK